VSRMDHDELGICPSCGEPIQGGYCQNCDSLPGADETEGIPGPRLLRTTDDDPELWRLFELDDG
jgi:hypothetical protein